MGIVGMGVNDDPVAYYSPASIESVSPTLKQVNALFVTKKFSQMTSLEGIFVFDCSQNRSKRIASRIVGQDWEQVGAVGD